MNKIIAIVGKTCAGKDTIATYIQNTYGIRSVCSYTTRPKRDYEIHGVQHYFIDKGEMRRILADEDVIAYTCNEETGIEYCATIQGLTADTMVYIINPDGISWLKEHTAQVSLSTIFVYAAEDELRRRAALRGDSIDKVLERINSERTEFDDFYNKKLYDYCINSEQGKESVFIEIDIIMEELGISPINWWTRWL